MHECRCLSHHRTNMDGQSSMVTRCRCRCYARTGAIRQRACIRPVGDKNETMRSRRFGICQEIGGEFHQVYDGICWRTGGIESLSVCCLHHQISPPTINISSRSECDLDYCANSARSMKIDVHEQQLGFGGTNGTLCSQDLIFGRDAGQRLPGDSIL